MQETHKTTKDHLINFKNKSTEQYDSKSHSNLIKVDDKVYLESKTVQNKPYLMTLWPCSCQSIINCL